VAAAEGGQAGLAEPGGRLWGWIVGQEGERDVAGQLAEHGLGSGPVGVQQRAQLVAGGGASADMILTQPDQGLQLPQPWIQGLESAQPVAVGA
jgi:hypothetical protein